MFLRYRQSKIEARAAIGHILRVDFTAMRFHDGAHNRQSHSQPMLLGGKELVEQAFVHFRANAGAMIAHAQAHFAVAIASRANLYLASVRWCLPHGIKGVTDQVNQDLLNLDRISFDRWQVLGQRCFYLAGIAHCIRPDDMRYIRDQLIQINPAPGRIAFLNCVAHILDDIVGAAPSASTSPRISRNIAGSSLPLSINRIPAFALLMMAESG